MESFFARGLPLLWKLIFISLGISGTVWCQMLDDGGYSEKCDWAKCLSPQLSDATKTQDKPNICRLLPSSLHCMQMKLPSCRHIMGEQNQMYQVFQKEMKKLRREYSEKCHAIYTTCTEFNKCLRPEIQEAAHHRDIQSLCQIAPPVISCFEAAIHTCETKSGYKDSNFEQLESKLNKIRLHTAARCNDKNSNVISGLNGPLLVIMNVMAILHGRHVLL